MNFLVLYVAMCVQLGPNDECSVFEPMSWEYTSQAEQQKAVKECDILAKAYAQLEDVQQVKCNPTK